MRCGIDRGRAEHRKEANVIEQERGQLGRVRTIERKIRRISVNRYIVYGAILMQGKRINDNNKKKYCVP